MCCLLGDCFWREGLEAGFGLEYKNPIEVTPIVEKATIQSQKSPAALYRASTKGFSGGVGRFRNPSKGGFWIHSG